jgi:hypothetical protein
MAGLGFGANAGRTVMQVPKHRIVSPTGKLKLCHRAEQ